MASLSTPLFISVTVSSPTGFPPRLLHSQAEMIVVTCRRCRRTTDTTLYLAAWSAEGGRPLSAGGWRSVNDWLISECERVRRKRESRSVIQGFMRAHRRSTELHSRKQRAAMFWHCEYVYLCQPAVQWEMQRLFVACGDMTSHCLYQSVLWHPTFISYMKLFFFPLLYPWLSVNVDHSTVILVTMLSIQFSA